MRQIIFKFIRAGRRDFFAPWATGFMLGREETPNEKFPPRISTRGPYTSRLKQTAFTPEISEDYYEVVPTVKSQKVPKLRTKQKQGYTKYNSFTFAWPTERYFPPRAFPNLSGAAVGIAIETDDFSQQPIKHIYLGDAGTYSRPDDAVSIEEAQQYIDTRIEQGKLHTDFTSLTAFGRLNRSLTNEVLIRVKYEPNNSNFGYFVVIFTNNEESRFLALARWYDLYFLHCKKTGTDCSIEEFRQKWPIVFYPSFKVYQADQQQEDLSYFDSFQQNYLRLAQNHFNDASLKHWCQAGPVLHHLTETYRQAIFNNITKEDADESKLKAFFAKINSAQQFSNFIHALPATKAAEYLKLKQFKFFNLGGFFNKNIPHDASLSFIRLLHSLYEKELITEEDVRFYFDDKFKENLKAIIANKLCEAATLDTWLFVVQFCRDGIDYTDASQNTLLSAAIFYKKLDVVKEAITLGANMHQLIGYEKGFTTPTQLARYLRKSRPKGNKAIWTEIYNELTQPQQQSNREWLRNFHLPTSFLEFIKRLLTLPDDEQMGVIVAWKNRLSELTQPWVFNFDLGGLSFTPQDLFNFFSHIADSQHPDSKNIIEFFSVRLANNLILQKKLSESQANYLMILLKFDPALAHKLELRQTHKNKLLQVAMNRLSLQHVTLLVEAGANLTSQVYFHDHQNLTAFEYLICKDYPHEDKEKRWEIIMHLLQLKQQDGTLRINPFSTSNKTFLDSPNKWKQLIQRMPSSDLATHFKALNAQQRQYVLNYCDLTERVKIATSCAELINETDSGNQTALILAVEERNLTHVKTLLTHDLLDMTIPRSDNLTAMDLAINTCQLRIAECLALHALKTNNLPQYKKFLASIPSIRAKIPKISDEMAQEYYQNFYAKSLAQAQESNQILCLLNAAIQLENVTLINLLIKEAVGLNTITVLLHMWESNNISFIKDWIKQNFPEIEDNENIVNAMTRFSLFNYSKEIFTARSNQQVCTSMLQLWNNAKTDDASKNIELTRFCSQTAVILLSNSPMPQKSQELTKLIATTHFTHRDWAPRVLLDICLLVASLWAPVLLGLRYLWVNTRNETFFYSQRKTKRQELCEEYISETQQSLRETQPSPQNVLP